MVGGSIMPLECKHVQFLSLVNSHGWETTPKWQVKRKAISMFASKVGSGFRNPFPLFLRDCPATLACRKGQHPSISLCAAAALGKMEGHRNYYLRNPSPQGDRLSAESSRRLWLRPRPDWVLSLLPHRKAVFLKAL